MNAPSFATALLLAVAAPAFAADCAATVASNDQMQFDKQALTVPKACKTFKLTLTHTGKLPKTAMGHNWVLTETSAMQGVVADGMAAGATNNFVKVGDTRVIAATKVIGGGESTSVDVPVAKLKAGTGYSFFCSFPGHSGIMKGTLTLGG